MIGASFNNLDTQAIANKQAQNLRQGSGIFDDLLKDTIKKSGTIHFVACRTASAIRCKQHRARAQVEAPRFSRVSRSASQPIRPRGS
jgi:hypothetical protein